MIQGSFGNRKVCFVVTSWLILDSKFSRKGILNFYLAFSFFFLRLMLWNLDSRPGNVLMPIGTFLFFFFGLAMFDHIRVDVACVFVLF